jgi:subtilisin
MQPLMQSARVGRSGPTLVEVLGGFGLPVIDQIAPDDAVLVALNADERTELLRALPQIKLVTAERLEPMWLQRVSVVRHIKAAEEAVTSSKTFVEVQVMDTLTREPLADVEVMLLTDREEGVGAGGITDRSGRVRLELPQAGRIVQSIEAYPRSGHWPTFAFSPLLSDGRYLLTCMPVDLSAPDIRRHFGLEGTDDDGRGVRVGIVDTGCSRHRDLRLAGNSRSLVQDALETDIDDVLGHGTHVAGVIAGCGVPGIGMRGVSPGVELVAYRVFGRGELTASSFHIAKGIRQAVIDGCDLINLSVGISVDVADVRREIEIARDQGVVCLAAAGNDYRGPVSYPARYPTVLAVSAFGRSGTWPAGAAQALEASAPCGDDPRDFIAAFSNAGREINLTAPGLGIVSTSPQGYAVMDGTSMACPLATGALARLLGRHPEILSMERTRQRADAIARLASSAQLLGFGSTFEGTGCLK